MDKNTEIAEKIGNLFSKTSEITAEQELLLEELVKNMDNIGMMSDAEIREYYGALKAKFNTDNSTKRLFKSYKKKIKSMIKCDKRRTIYRKIPRVGKYLTFFAFLYGVWLAISTKGMEYWMIPFRQGSDIIDYISLFIKSNVHAFINYVPGSEISIILFILGIIVYIGSKAMNIIDDSRSMRRMMVHAMAENISEKEMNALSNMFIANSIKIRGVGNTTIYSVKDAMKTTPMIDYGKSVDTLIREQNEREKEKESIKAESESEE